MLGALTLVLSGCGWQWPHVPAWEKDPFDVSGRKKLNTPPPPIVIPEDEPDQNDEASKLIPASTLGLNLKTYFAQDIQDPVLRTKRLENALVAVHEDLKKISDPAPLLAYREPREKEPENLSEIQQAFGTQPREVIASGQPQSLLSAKPNAQSIGNLNKALGQGVKTPETNKTSPARAQEKKPPNPAINGATIITGIRIGEHSDKLRIVMDLSKKTLYSADLDNGEGLLVIELPDAGLSAAAQKTFATKLPVIKSYRVDPYNDGAGNIIAFELKADSTILNQSQIPALSGSGARIFIDLAK